MNKNQSLISSKEDPSLVTPLELDVSDWDRTEQTLKAAIAGKQVNFLVKCSGSDVRQSFGQVTSEGADRYLR